MLKEIPAAPIIPDNIYIKSLVLIHIIAELIIIDISTIQPIKIIIFTSVLFKELLLLVSPFCIVFPPF
jgi:hypothetical protein